ncbi:hypothetical protein ABT217_28245 [Streptomyces collinus]
MAALVWAPLAAGLAVLVNVPIRGFVERPRPFVDHRGLDNRLDQRGEDLASGAAGVPAPGPAGAGARHPAAAVRAEPPRARAPPAGPDFG